MTLFERYMLGETVDVYKDLYALGQDALSPDNFIQTELVLKETFERVKFNLDIIYKELKAIDYHFVDEKLDKSDGPLLNPDPNFDSILEQINRTIKNCGHLPLSLIYFYKIVGSCNFCWNWQTMPDVPWEGADPIDIPPIKTLLSDLIYEGYDRDDILFAGDYLQKDNISGSCYNIQLTPELSIDALLLHENWDIYFIEYLRITMDNCGFSMADQSDYPDLTEFCERVRPMLKKI